MKDIRGFTIQKGDLVFYNRPGKYKDLSFGVVVGFTPKMVRIQRHRLPEDHQVNVWPDSIGIHLRVGGQLAYRGDV